MELSQTQTRHRKKRLTQEQVRLLENSFTANKKLEPELKLQLANQLGVPPRQVAVWYQNKRARCKTQALELDHNILQVKLENALADKKRLELEVKLLQEELKKSQDHLAVLVMNPVDGSNCSSDRFVSNRSSCEEGASSEDVHHHHHQVLEFDELYACLVSSGHGSSRSPSWI